MPEKKIVERARKAKREGKAPTTQAGEFVKEEMKQLHKGKGKNGPSSEKQAIAIGLSKARKAGVKVPPPKAKSGPTKRSKSE